MKRDRDKKRYILIPLVLGILLLAPTHQVAAQGAKTGESGLQTEPPTPENVDSHIAGMSDAQVRQAYAQILKHDAETRSA